MAVKGTGIEDCASACDLKLETLGKVMSSMNVNFAYVTDCLHTWSKVLPTCPVGDKLFWFYVALRKMADFAVECLAPCKKHFNLIGSLWISLSLSFCQLPVSLTGKWWWSETAYHFVAIEMGTASLTGARGPRALPKKVGNYYYCYLGKD